MVGHVAGGVTDTVWGATQVGCNWHWSGVGGAPRSRGVPVRHSADGVYSVGEGVLMAGLFPTGDTLGVMPDASVVQQLGLAVAEE